MINVICIITVVISIIVVFFAVSNTFDMVRYHKQQVVDFKLKYPKLVDISNWKYKNIDNIEYLPEGWEIQFIDIIKNPHALYRAILPQQFKDGLTKTEKEIFVDELRIMRDKLYDINQKNEETKHNRQHKITRDIILNRYK